MHVVGGYGRRRRRDTLKRFGNLFAEQHDNFGKIVFADLLPQLIDPSGINHVASLHGATLFREGKRAVSGPWRSNFIIQRKLIWLPHTGIMNSEANSQSFGISGAVGETVLVVDDSRAHRRLLGRTLERWGYVVLEADGGDAAMEICRGTDIGLIVSDWMMPGMSGVEFCRAYRDMHRDGSGYFILLTAQTDTEALAEGLESGADDFLSKPFGAVELRARLRAGERVLKAQRALAAKNTELSSALKKLSQAYSAIDRDLRAARRFQEALVPDPHVPMETVDVSLMFRPSGHVGGDMVGYFPVREGEMGLYSVDVSGHGVSSALMTARIASYFSGTAPDRNIALARKGGDFSMLPPDEVCGRLNRLLRSEGESEHYLTMVLAHLSVATGELNMCVAGHPSPMLLRKGGKPEFLQAYGMPIGLLDEAEFATCRVTLGPEDMLLIYSDGLTECPGSNGGLLDEEGLARIVTELAGKPGPDLLSKTLQSLEAYSGTDTFPDDVSAILVERH